MSDLLLLRGPVLEERIGMPLALAAAEEAFLRLAQGDVRMPTRLHTPVGERGTHLSMPAWVAGEPGQLAIKVVTVFPDNPAAFALPTTLGTLLVHCAHTGRLLALLDAEYLTALRTGAASALATKLLAPPDARHLFLIGSGGQAWYQLEGVAAVRPIERVSVHARDARKLAVFCERAREHFALDVRPAPLDAVATADVVCLATNAREPILQGPELRAGTHVNAIGAFRPDLCELGPAAIARARVVVDHLPAARAQAGDLIQAERAGAFRFERATELGARLLDRAPKASDGRDLTLFKSVGLAVQDAVLAGHVYRDALLQGFGETVSW